MRTADHAIRWAIRRRPTRGRIGDPLDDESVEQPGVDLMGRPLNDETVDQPSLQPDKASHLLTKPLTHQSSAELGKLLDNESVDEPIATRMGRPHHDPLANEPIPDPISQTPDDELV